MYQLTTESRCFLYCLHQSHLMLWAAVFVWHCLIQSSLLKCPVRTWKETAASWSKWAAQIHCQCCHHENNSMGLGLELITFPFPPCTGKRWSVHLDCSLSVNTAPLKAAFPCYLQPAMQRGTAQPFLLEAHTHHQTSTGSNGGRNTHHHSLHSWRSFHLKVS